jgi:hypothetical protein
MKTAVEWLVEQLNLHEYEDVIKQAKEMDKERVIDFAKKFSDFNGLTFNEKEVSKEYLEKLYDEYHASSPLICRKKSKNLAYFGKFRFLRYRISNLND